MGKHYSQQGTEISYHLTHADTLLRVRLQGFIESAQLREQADHWWPEVFGQHPVRAILCNPSEVSGFEWDLPRVAAEFLRKADREKLARVAIVSPSSVLRTTIQLLRPQLRVNVGCFLSESNALSWLGEILSLTPEPKPPAPEPTSRDCEAV